MRMLAAGWRLVGMKGAPTMAVRLVACLRVSGLVSIVLFSCYDTCKFECLRTYYAKRRDQMIVARWRPSLKQNF